MAFSSTLKLLVSLPHDLPMQMSTVHTDRNPDTPQGGRLLQNFAVGICGASQNWTMSEFIGQEIKRIRDLVGPVGQVLGAVSGGVDSTVAAKLMTEAFGDRFHAVLVDNGCMRLDDGRLLLMLPATGPAQAVALGERLGAAALTEAVWGESAAALIARA